MTAPHRWRWPIALSVGAHIIAAALFYLYGDHLGQLTDVAGIPQEARAASTEEEQDNWVMDVGDPVRPAAVVPSVDPPAPTVPPARPAGDSTASATQPKDSPPASGGHESSGGANQQIRPPGAPIGGPPPRTNPGATTTFFQVPTHAQSVVYVFDRSGSMGMGGRLSRARRELLDSLDRLPPTVRFQIIPYNRSAEPLWIAGHHDLVPATAENKQQAALLLEGLVPEGGTEHLTALKRALLFQPEAIFFLTDADDLHPDQVRALTLLNHGHTTIHTIELTASHRDVPGTPLHVLARENGGEYRGVDVP